MHLEAALFTLFEIMSAASQGSSSLTAPVAAPCWTQERVFHAGGVWDNLQGRIAIGFVERGVHQGGLSSPNSGYRFWTERSPEGRSTFSDVVIDSEQDEWVRLSFENLDHLDTPHWINEKLLFVRAWWGQRVATDVVLDVENARIVSSEMAERSVPASASGECRMVARGK